MSAPARFSTEGSGLARLRRLRGRSLAEVVERGRQELAKIGERVIPGSGHEVSDAAFVRLVAPASRTGSAERTAAAVLARLRALRSGEPGAGGTFFAAAGRVPEIASVASRAYRADARATVERAERAVDGEFALLGLDRVLFGRPVDWHLEPLSGKRAPLAHWSAIDYLDADVAGDKKVTWELNRHAHFVVFGQAYALTGDERYAVAFVEQATSWLDQNPPNMGINWASSLELAFRSIAWLWALHLLAPSPAVTPRFFLRAMKSLAAHGRHIETYLSHFFSPNTHLTGEALGLYYLGTALPELGHAAEWRETGLRILAHQLGTQVRPDGVYFEQTSYYHRYTAEVYLHAVALSRDTGWPLPDGFEDRVKALAEHLMWISEPHGTTPLVGDDDGGRLIDAGWRGPRDFRDALTLAAALFENPEWRFVAGDRAPEVLWLLGPEAHERYRAMEAREPSGLARAFPNGGYYVMRDGWTRDAAYALVDCGPHGALSCGHAHADALSIAFAAHGVSWLADPGTFTYTGDRTLRDDFRTTAAHNTVTVDGASQSVPSGPFSWESVAAARPTAFVGGAGLVWFEGAHDGYERLEDPVTHTRSVLFVGRGLAGAPAYLVVRDAFAAAGRHSYVARFHLPAASVAVLGDARVVAVDPGGASLVIVAVGAPVAPDACVASGWVSEVYGRREPAPVAAFSVSAEGPEEVLSVVVPSADLEQSPRIEPIGAGAGLTMDFGAAFDVVLRGNGREAGESTRLRAVAELAWARFAAGRAVAACFGSGSLVEVDGSFTLSTPHARFAAVSLGARVEVTIDGAATFELVLVAGADAVVVNGSDLPGCAPGSRMTFVPQGSGWTSLPPPQREN
jgi:hypothetical protein